MTWAKLENMNMTWERLEESVPIVRDETVKECNMRSQGQFGANYSVNGHRTSSERRVDFNKG